MEKKRGMKRGEVKGKQRNKKVEGDVLNTQCLLPGGRNNKG